MKLAKFLRTLILKNICERQLLFVSTQNTTTYSGGEFGLDETSRLFFKRNNFIQSNTAT